MSNLSFLSQIGCFVAEEFLSADQCKQLRAEAVSSKSVPATMVDESNEVNLNEARRKTKIVEISDADRLSLSEKILAIKPQIEEYFSIELAGCQVPQLLNYHPGDYFKIHRDVNEQNSGNPELAGRRVSAVIFLNEQSPEPKENCFGGGLLNLYGLIDQPVWKDKAFPIKGETGLLIAFRSETLHEVTEVTYGERFTVVNWFY